MVWNGQTDGDRTEMIECLERDDAFENLKYLPSGRLRGDGRYGDFTMYYIDPSTTLYLVEASDTIDHIYVRSDRDLSEAEKAALTRCAPYPSMPL